jgi:hypothetical protein
MGIDELVQAANQLDGKDLEQLVSRVLLLRAKRQAPVLTKGFPLIYNSSIEL